MLDTDYPVVTIIIANRNYSKYLKDAVDSALSQKYPASRFRVMIVDDASDDDSWEVLHKNYFKKIPHRKLDLSFKSKEGEWTNGVTISAIKCPEAKGPSAARNIAIASTFPSTDIYTILDADDIYYKDKVIKLVTEMMRDRERIGVVYADYDILNVETGNIIREYKKPYDKLKLYSECIVHSGAIINKKVLEQVYESTGYYDETMRTCEDYDLWLRISDKFMIIHVPESLSLVRVHKENATYSVKDEVWQQNWRRVQEKTLARQNGQTGT